MTSEERITKYKITVWTVVVIVAFAICAKYWWFGNETNKVIKIGFVYVGDLSDSYTNNYIKAQNAVEKEFGAKVLLYPKYNVPETGVEKALDELVLNDCDMIFTTSYGYSEAAKKYAEKYPDIEFCQATGSNANEEPVLKNYHTFMGAICQGRYISGVVAGMKLKELIIQGKITSEQAKIGYIGAYPFAEVISGYTAFFLGVRSVVPEATMTVKYTYSWGSYQLEKEYAEQLINENCVIISQHSDTSGPAVACEQTERSKIVYYVSYNESMRDVAPTTYLTGTKINWTPYFTEAVSAVIHGRKIESHVKGRVNGNDICAGFDRDWVQMLEINERSAAEGTKERVNELIEQFKRDDPIIFKGDYTGVNPNDPTDTINLKDGYRENEKSSSPTFGYILKDVITIE